ncbi:helix-turn-helix domain-containing protein [Enterococcus sp. HY326]|uniref:helix-turn-helix domain-containing protein n=1 Tax=Enterococcus sp. HY326 TaxID=2971265 RepID=UPI00223F4C2A|nr:helix-turn-helix domain-containing protein [Enterococcus sp. HY326]
MEKSLGQVLRKIRKERNMTQKMLCENICSQSVLSRIEGDIELPNVLVVQQLCDRLGVSIDQVVNHNVFEKTDNVMLFEQFADLYRHNRFQELSIKISSSNIIDFLFSEKEFLLFYYYMGSCEYYLHRNLEKSLKYLKTGLNYIGNVSHLSAKDEDVQLISCTGKVYAEMGKSDKAEYYMSRSVELFADIPNERAAAESIKIFFNYASFLQKQGYYETSMEMIDKGLDLAHKKNSYYFVDQLFELKRDYYSFQGNIDKADKYHKLSLQLKKIVTAT